MITLTPRSPRWKEDIRNARDNIQKVVSEGEKAKAAGDEGKQGFWLRTETQLRKELNELLAWRKQLWDQKGKESLQLGKGTSLQCCPLPADLSAWRRVNLTSSHQADRVLPCSSNNCRGMTETLVHTQEALLGLIPSCLRSWGPCSNCSKVINAKSHRHCPDTQTC